MITEKAIQTCAIKKALKPACRETWWWWLEEVQAAVRKKKKDCKGLKQNNIEEAKGKYKASKNEAKRAVAKARAKCSEKFSKT